ncbi:MAG: hypothetical protein LBJ67_00155 [Planctomycetaceae bacterium]|nr:hypothetical protein [Planctomycetaceae bacterium]
MSPIGVGIKLVTHVTHSSEHSGHTRVRIFLSDAGSRVSDIPSETAILGF